MVKNGVFVFKGVKVQLFPIQVQKVCFFESCKPPLKILHVPLFIHLFFLKQTFRIKGLIKIPQIAFKE